MSRVIIAVPFCGIRILLRARLSVPVSRRAAALRI